MPPKYDLSEKDAPPAKKQSRKTITLEQKVDIIRRYDGGESTAAIKAALNLPESSPRCGQSGRTRRRFWLPSEQG